MVDQQDLDAPADGGEAITQRVVLTGEIDQDVALAAAAGLSALAGTNGA